MKKIFIIFGSIITFILLVVAMMFFGDVCPPPGPWPTPPWCAVAERNNYVVDVHPVKLSQIKAVNMFDTWGRNYNMSMIETTRNNISSSFERVKELGASEVYVHDFHWAVFDKGSDFTTTNYQIKDETFWNDFRDESMTESDVKKLVEAAHKNNLKLGIKHNISFVNIRKYLAEGIKGSIENAVVTDYERFNADHSEEWIRDYFKKFSDRLVERAKIYNNAGVDILSISPTFMGPKFSGHEDIANELQKQLITDLRQVFKGKIYTEVSQYGFSEDIDGKEDWTKYDFYKNADIIEIRVYGLPKKFQQMGSNEPLTAYIKELDNIAGKKGIKLSVFFAPSSYKDSLNIGPLEVLDYKNEKIINTNSDYDYQVQAFNTFFNAVLQSENIERINVANFSWDDYLDPFVKPKLSINAGFRNKPAEEVIKAWFNQD
jgi:hypothetical protein